MNTTHLRPTRRSALLGFFVTTAIAFSGFGTATAQASPASGSETSASLCASLARGVKAGTWKVENATRAVSEPFRKTANNTGLSGLDGRTHWYGVRLNADLDRVGGLVAQCSVYVNGKWGAIGYADLAGKIVPAALNTTGRVEIVPPLTQAQCNQMVAAQAIESWSVVNGTATSKPSPLDKIPGVGQTLKSVINAGVSLLGTNPIVSVVVGEIDKKTTNLPAVCYGWDAKTSTYIPIGKGTVSSFKAGGGRLTFR